LSSIISYGIAEQVISIGEIWRESWKYVIWK